MENGIFKDIENDFKLLIIGDKKYTLKRKYFFEREDVKNYFQNILDKNGFSFKFPHRLSIIFLKKYFNKTLKQCFYCKKPTSNSKYCSPECQSKGFDRDKRTENRRKNCMEKYGVTSSSILSSTIEKVRQTKIERYGSETFHIQKMLQTKIEKYGFHGYNNREKLKNTIEERGISLEDFYKDNIKKCIENYSMKNGKLPCQKDIKNFEFWDDETFIKNNFIQNDRFLINDFINFFGVDRSTAVCKKQKLNIDLPNKTEKHKTQNFIFDSINTNNKILNDRSLGFELDIYLPDHQLAIEYNGLIYHSQGLSKYSRFDNPDFDINYHLNKTLKCKESGIQLFHIFEGEDINLWLSMINNKLGLNKKIYARKCIIKELKYSQIKDFLDENHLQRSCVSKINLGLFHESELVQIMTFSKPRFNKNYEYELIRLCSLKNTTIVGGASKLLKYFIKKYNPKNIISYANRRFSNGDIYSKLGFVLEEETNPNYFYFDFYDKLLVTDKKHLVNKSDIRTIYDCGDLVFKLEF